MTVMLCPASAALSAPAGRVVYVDVAARGFDDGTSWANAYTDLQDALDDVELTGDCLPETPCEIWVAKGTYFPSRRTDPADPTSATFMLMNNVGIYGGFGAWETERRQRDVDLNETIFNGDHNMDDDPTLEPTSNCCVDRTGEAGCDDPACEQLVVSQRPHRDCANDWDAGCSSWARIYCCDVCRPSYCDNSEEIVLAFEVGATAVIDGLTITSGEAQLDAGGLYVEFADPTVRHCTFTDHRRLAVDSLGGNPTFENCTFIRNRGAGASNFIGEASYTDCDFIENSSVGLVYRSSKLLSGCRFIRNGNTGLIISSGNAPNIVNCQFIENSSNSTAGVSATFGFPQFINCRFFGNTSTGSVGGLKTDSVILVNCVFSGNTGFWHGAMEVAGGSALLLNCAFVHNSASAAGAMGIGGTVSVENSIFWNNISGSEVGAGISFNNDTLPSINYSVLHDWTPLPNSVGNVDLDPLFVDADGPDGIVGTEDDNLRLSMFSPVIDLGDPDPPLAPFSDADGHVRILRGRIDMGAYEFGIGDYDEDRFCTLFDFVAWEACMTGPDEYPFEIGCEAFDFHAELTDHIDLLDFAGFQRICSD